MSVLAAYRHHRNWSEEVVATHLGITLQEYQDLECGIDIPDVDVLIKLSELFTAPVQVFLHSCTAQHHTTIFSNCAFTGNGASGYFHHVYHDMAKDKDQTIAALNDQITMLRDQNEKLIAALLNQAINRTA